MKDIVERLREKAPSLGFEDHDPTFDDRMDAAKEIERLRKRLSDNCMEGSARNVVLEEAAKVADARARVSRVADKPSQLIHVSMTLAQFEAEAIATAIRALKEGAKLVDASPAPLPPEAKSVD